jgi:hypothetical protein
MNRHKMKVLRNSCTCNCRCYPSALTSSNLAITKWLCLRAAITGIFHLSGFFYRCRRSTYWAEWSRYFRVCTKTGISARNLREYPDPKIYPPKIRLFYSYRPKAQYSKNTRSTLILICIFSLEKIREKSEAILATSRLALSRGFLF